MKWRIIIIASLIGFHANAWTLFSPKLKGWKDRKLVVQVNVSDCGIAESLILPIIDRSIAIWNGVPTAQLSVSRAPALSALTAEEFLQGKGPNAPVILCDTGFASHTNSDPDQIPGATIPGRDYPLRYGGILLNAQAGAGAEIASLTENQLHITIAHELGHVLGLGHSKYAKALMYYSIAKKSDALLSEDDRDGLSFLYPRQELTSGAFGCASVSGSDDSIAPIVLFFLGCLFCLIAPVLRRKTGRR